MSNHPAPPPEIPLLLTAFTVYGATIGFTVWYVGPLRYDEWGLPLAVSWIFCLVLAARWPNAARLTTLFHAGWSFAAVVICWYRAAVLGFAEHKFGGPRGTFVFAVSVLWAVGIVAAIPFALATGLILPRHSNRFSMFSGLLSLLCGAAAVGLFCLVAW